MRLRDIGVVLTLALGILAAPLSTDAQQPGKVPSIGYLSPGSTLSHGPLLAAFRQGLRELGYWRDKTIAIESRWAEGKQDRLPQLAAELALLNVDVIVTSGTPATLAAKRATRTIPIVMAGVGDPVGSGLVASLARPRENVTGLSLLIPELGAKRLQLLTEVVPGLSRVAFLWNSANAVTALVLRETEVGARTLAVQLQSLEVRGPGDFEGAFKAATRAHAGGVIVVEDPLTVVHRARIVELAAKSRLPAMYGLKEFVTAGGFMSYGANLADLYRRAATFVDKILKGAKPADLPVEQATRFELVINLKTAKALGLTLPQSILIRADKIIE